MVWAQMVAFHEVKHGNPPWEWEDCAGYSEGGQGTGPARCIVVDGATEAYDSLRWVRQLVESFVGIGDESTTERPSLTLKGLRRWFELMQRRWVEGAPTVFANIFEERKFHDEGSFATMLCCQIDGLDGPRPTWTAAALGDTVLFHVRDRVLLQQFPEIEADDFGLNPDGIFTHAAQLEGMCVRLQLYHHNDPLMPGDHLFLATDALAEWMLRQCRVDPDGLWDWLASLDNKLAFAKMVADYRRARQLKNDDVTLLRVTISAVPPDFVVMA
jgi:hypothetical protein